MPELPEVETVRRTLAPVVGATIAGAWHSGKKLRSPVTADELTAGVVGRTITGLSRIGKYLLIETSGERSILVHLGMSGRVRIHRGGDPMAKHTHVVFALADGRELRFTDARRFGQVSLAPRAAPRSHPSLADLGRDPLTEGIDGRYLWAEAQRRNTTLKAFLLDQRVIAGLGNIYVSEALWRAKLAPSRRSRTLSRQEAGRLARAATAVLEHALHRGGTSLRDFVDADGEAGENIEYLRVYGRAGTPCPRCRHRLRRGVHQGRATYWCPTCQRGSGAAKRTR